MPHAQRLSFKMAHCICPALLCHTECGASATCSCSFNFLGLICLVGPLSYSWHARLQKWHSICPSFHHLIYVCGHAKHQSSLGKLVTQSRLIACMTSHLSTASVWLLCDRNIFCCPHMQWHDCCPLQNGVTCSDNAHWYVGLCRGLGAWVACCMPGLINCSHDPDLLWQGSFRNGRVCTHMRLATILFYSAVPICCPCLILPQLNTVPA